MAKILLARGADPLILDSTGALAIDNAEYEGHDELVAYLRPLSILPSEPRHDWTEGRRTSGWVKQFRAKQMTIAA